jgi:dTDP-4-amino-4,6-dideoxygalactose transaminase
VFPVHLNGQCADMAGIAAVAARHGLAVVEDACHALGTRHVGAGPVGSCPYSTMATFSTHPVKAIAMGEGGVVTTNVAAMGERVARFRNHGMTRDPAAFKERELAFAGDGTAHPWYYEMAEVGVNYRAPDILCALGLSQLKKLPRFVARRQALAERYDSALRSLAPLVEPVPRMPWSGHAFHLYVVQIDFAAARITRDAVMQALRADGVGTQVHYIPVHRQPYYRERYGALSLPGADAYYRGCLSLPIFPAMTEADVDRVVRALSAVLAN